jgi:anti-sigma factor RsiW
MTKGEAPVREEDLHAYVDGALEGARRRQIEDYLARHPDVAARVQGHADLRQRLRDALAPVTEEPIPPELDLRRMVEAHRQRRRVPWRIAASIVLALGIGGVGGWNLRGTSQAPAGGIAALAREAAASYQVYAADPARPVEMPAAASAQLVTWISQRLGRPIALPDLAPAGYRFIGGRLVSTEHGPAGLFIYDDPQGKRIAVMVRSMAVERNTPMSAHKQDGVAGYAWSDQGLGYSVVASASAADIHPVADEVRRQAGTRSRRG